MIKKKLGRYVVICDVCNEPGPDAETFAGAVAAKGGGRVGVEALQA